MKQGVRRLLPSDEAALQELLEEDLQVNLFLLGFLQHHSLERTWWIGQVLDDRVVGAVLVIPGRLCVPFGSAASMAAIGSQLKGARPPRLLVGPRADCDILYEAWGSPGQKLRWYDQRLYVMTEPPTWPGATDLRRARADEWRPVALAASTMEREDLGVDPSAEDPELHAATVKERLKDGRTWVVERGGRIVFQINVGTSTPWGCQIGGTWVPPSHRGRGLATDGMAAICHKLLETHPMVTLHVNEGNPPAVRVYEKVGFQRGAAYRLAILEPTR